MKLLKALPILVSIIGFTACSTKVEHFRHLPEGTKETLQKNANDSELDTSGDSINAKNAENSEVVENTIAQQKSDTRGIAEKVDPIGFITKLLSEKLPGWGVAYGSELPTEDLTCEEGHYLSGIDKAGLPICNKIILPKAEISSVNDVEDTYVLRDLRCADGSYLVGLENGSKICRKPQCKVVSANNSFVNCPSGTILTGGGGATRDGVGLHMIKPTSRQMQVSAPGKVPHEMRTHAVCCSF